MILLDTHVAIWETAGSPKLGRESRRRIDLELHRNELAISAISSWEVALLMARGRLGHADSADAMRAKWLALGIREIPIDGAVAVVAGQLHASHGDPADGLIVATAMVHRATLLTADQVLLSWRHGLKTMDATR